MEIILLQDVEKVGDKHTIITVKDGFGRNYLIPQKLAIIANKTNRARLSDLRKREEAKENQLLGFYKEIADKLSKATLRIGAKSGTSGKIFGSVTSIQLAQALKEQFDIDIDRKKIVMQDEVKELGTYTADLNLHKEVETKVSFEVVSE